jgi:hypothetical protein
MIGCRHTGTLGGTSWNVVEVISLQQPDLLDMDVQFGTDGWVTSTIAHEDGTKETSRRQYSVYRSLLVVSRPDDDLQLLHRIEGDELFLTDENFQARLRRTN